VFGGPTGRDRREVTVDYINVKICGVPYCRTKTRGRVDAPLAWSAAIIDQTKHLSAVQDACMLRMTFLLPPEKYPRDFPHGPDLDNLLKRSLDALGQTIFKSTHGGDSCVVSLVASKTRVDSVAEAGVWLEVLPISIAPHHAVESTTREGALAAGERGRRTSG
jgi:Holliday junction resolvase RusA-like endonuclease